MFHKAGAVAASRGRCVQATFVVDVCTRIDGLACLSASADVFYLDTFPCRRIEIVGLVVGIDVRENKTTFLGAQPPPSPLRLRTTC